MNHIKKLDNLNGTVHEHRDTLVEGYSVSMDNEDFSVFVLYEYRGNNPKGYALKIAYHSGLDTDVDLKDTKRFPLTNVILNKYCKGLWKTGRERHCYKFVVFGQELKDKIFAVTIMRQIACDILMSAPIE